MLRIKNSSKITTIVLIIGGAIITGSMAYADLEIKEYKGTTIHGEPCSFKVESINFENNVRHPLNERVQAQIFGESYTLQHPRQTEYTTGMVTFDHDRLELAIPTSTGAKTVQVKLSHEPGNTGPVEVLRSNHLWKTNTVEKEVCSNLK